MTQSNKRKENKKMLTPQQKQNYIEKPNHCPYCGSGYLTPSHANFDGNIVTEDISCGECDKEWTDIYKLINIEEI
jgi:transcription elongation factor Elf1